MIAYFKCLCGANRQKAKRLAADGYEIRITKVAKWREEAESYGEKLPFKVTDGKVERV